MRRIHEEEEKEKRKDWVNLIRSHLTSAREELEHSKLDAEETALNMPELEQLASFMGSEMVATQEKKRARQKKEIDDFLKEQFKILSSGVKGITGILRERPEAEVRQLFWIRFETWH